jgi:hypothetical protein
MSKRVRSQPMKPVETPITARCCDVCQCPLYLGVEHRIKDDMVSILQPHAADGVAVRAKMRVCCRHFELHYHVDQGRGPNLVVLDANEVLADPSLRVMQKPLPQKKKEKSIKAQSASKRKEKEAMRVRREAKQQVEEEKNERKRIEYEERNRELNKAKRQRTIKKKHEIRGAR